MGKMVKWRKVENNGGILMISFYISLVNTPEEADKITFIYTEYRKLMLHTAYQYLGDYQLAEDAVHETFLKLIKIISKIDMSDLRKFRSFIVIITKNKCLDMKKADKGKDNGSTEEMKEYLESEEKDPIDEVLTQEGIQKTIGAISKLSETNRIACQLKFVHGYSVEEISNILDVPLKTIYARLAAGKVQIKKTLKKEADIYINQ